MSLRRQREIARRAEARAVQARERMRAHWWALRDESAAAATSGRVLLAGLVSGCAAGVLLGQPRRSPSAHAVHRAPLWPELVRALLPALLPAIRSGLAAARKAGRRA